MHPDAGVFDGTVYRKLSNAIANAPLHYVAVSSEVSNLACTAPNLYLSRG